MEIEIIFEDEDLLVLEKPAGITVNRSDTTKGERTVQDWMGQYIKGAEVAPPRRGSSRDFSPSQDFITRSGIVHRLDKETSGILLVAKNQEAFENLQQQFKERRVKKVYTALVHGKVVPSDGEIRVPVGRLPWNRKRFGVVAGGREAVTKYKVIRCFEVRNGKWDSESLNSRNQDVNPSADGSSSKISHFSLLEIYPETGRTHQIRVHLKHIGHPVFSDPLYAGRKTARNDRKVLFRMFLHASKIWFTHPKTEKLISFESPLPEELNELLNLLHS